MARLIGPLMCLAVLVTGNPAIARADGGDLLWQVVLEPSSNPLFGPNRPGRLAAAKGRIVLVNTETRSTQPVFAVEARDGRTGKVIWADRTAGTAQGVVMDAHRVVAGGNATDSTGSRAVIRTLHPRTGALLWKAAWRGTLWSLALDGKRVLVAGTISEGGVSRNLIRAYSAERGTVEWQDFPSPAGFTSLSFAGTHSVVLHDGKAFMVAVVRPGIPGIEFSTACFVRAYNARNGTVLWDATQILVTNCVPRAIAAAGQHVAIGAGGGLQEDNLFVAVFDSETGSLEWNYRTFNGSGLDNAITAIDVANRQVLIAAWDNSAPNTTGGFKEAFILRSFDVFTGLIRWEDVLFTDETGSFLWHALDLDVERRRVFAVGEDVAHGTWVARAYRLRDGALLWAQEFQPAGGTDYGASQAVVADRGRVFVIGRATNAMGTVELLLRAYDAR